MHPRTAKPTNGLHYTALNERDAMKKLLTGILLTLVLVGCGSASSTQQPATQPTQKIQPTQGQATITTQAQNNITPTRGTPHLGGPISDFVGAYGTPDAHSDYSPGGDTLHFLPSTTSNVDGLIVSTDPSEPTLAANIIVAATNGTVWTVGDANDRCMTFAPSDAQFVKKYVYADNSGFDLVYTSAQLAKDFPASAFTDSKQEQVQAGTFDVLYLYASDGQHIDDCDMIIGEQQTTN